MILGRVGVFIACFLIVSLAQADEQDLVVVISVKNTTVQSISEKQLRTLYLGKRVSMPDGTAPQLTNYKPMEKIFNKIALRHSDAQVKALWSKLKFSGRSKEPALFESADKLIEYLAKNSNAIAYLPVSAITEDVRIILELKN